MFADGRTDPTWLSEGRIATLPCCSPCSLLSDCSSELGCSSLETEQQRKDSSICFFPSRLMPKTHPLLFATPIFLFPSAICEKRAVTKQKERITEALSLWYFFLNPLLPAFINVLISSRWSHGLYSSACTSCLGGKSFEAEFTRAITPCTHAMSPICTLARRVAHF